jgi:hypothetical protein
MKMPFGHNKDRELDDIPDRDLHWIVDKMELEPRPNTPHDKVDEYRKANVGLKAEARRILRERRKNGVTVAAPAKPAGIKWPRERKSDYR